MASRFSRRVRRPVAFLVTLAMAISAFSGGLMGFTAQAAQPDVTGIPANSAYVVYGDAATGTAASSNLTVDASAETTHQPTLQYIVDRYAMKCPDGTGNGNDWSYFYCKTGVDFQAQFTGTNNLTVSIDYYDDPALAGQKFEIWCNDNGGNSWPGVTMAGSGQWVTANLAVSNMTFGGINGGNDFRITSKTPNLAISRIVVTPGAVTLTPGGPDPIPRTASYTFGADLAGSVAKGMNLTGNTTDNGGAYDSFGTFGGKPAYVSIANTGDWNYIWYTLDSAYSQLPVADMTMVVTYFDASTAKGSTFNIWYKSFDGANVNDAWADTVTLQGTDTWQQAYCQLPAADVAETVQNGQNFRLTITSTQGTTGIPFSEADFYSYRVDAPPAPEQPKVSPDPVSVTFTGTDKDENGLEFYPMNDSPAENPGIYTTVDGQGAFQVNNPMRPDGDDAAYMWLRADADFASNASQTVTALVNYYDDPAHAGYNFEIWYVDTAGGNHWVPVTLAGTGEWKTAYMTLSNMKFG
ncbi:MAG: hypothetical protein FWF44_05670, partial [Defluviitaleaceae bacterium]|nr:hypothetical protein [Defluviitaleaceae bacterium]